MIRGLILFLCFMLQSICAQTTDSAAVKRHSVKDYPEGFYYDYEDFVNKNVRPPVRIQRRTVADNQRIPKDSLVDNIFFLRMRDGSQVNDVFAISFEGQLYFLEGKMSRHARKGDKTQEGHHSNSYHRVSQEGRFFYMEGIFANAIAKGALIGGGGVAGAVSASNLDRLKAVIFDFDTMKFDFFKHCKNFQEFLDEKKYPEVIDCKTFNIEVVREIMSRYNH